MQLPFLPDDAIVHMGGSSVALPNADYFVSRSILEAIANVSSDIVMAESESFVYANMASASAYETVTSNILNDCAWFSNTHGSSTLEPWVSPMAPGFNIPDAKQEAACQGRYDASACGASGSNYVFDSCENPFGLGPNCIWFIFSGCAAPAPLRIVTIALTRRILYGFASP